jgi:hypothetical protein
MREGWGIPVTPRVFEEGGMTNESVLVFDCKGRLDKLGWGAWTGGAGLEFLVGKSPINNASKASISILLLWSMLADLIFSK